MLELSCVLRGRCIMESWLDALVANTYCAVPSAFGHRHVSFGASIAHAVPTFPAVMLRYRRYGGRGHRDGGYCRRRCEVSSADVATERRIWNLVPLRWSDSSALSVMLTHACLTISSSGIQYAGLARSLTALRGPENIEVNPDRVSDTLSVTLRAWMSCFSSVTDVAIPLLLYSS